MRLPIIAILIAAFLWALEGVVLLPRLSGLDVTFVVFLLHAFGFLFLQPIAWKEYRHLSSLSKSDWFYLFLIALFGGALGTIAIVKALFLVQFMQLSIVVLLQKLQPIFAILLAYIILKEQPKKIFYAWAALALVGSYFMTFGLQGPVLGTPNDTLLPAAALALLAAFAFGSSTVFSRKLALRYHFRTLVFYRYGLTSILLFPVLLLMGGISVSTLTTNHWYLVTIIPLTTGLGSMLLYYYGMKHVRASIATMCELFFPLSAIVLDYVLHGNMLSMVQWVGAAVLLLAIYHISNLRKEKETKPRKKKKR